VTTVMTAPALKLVLPDEYRAPLEPCS
jgi:hypothetical protein